MPDKSLVTESAGVKGGNLKSTHSDPRAQRGTIVESHMVMLPKPPPTLARIGYRGILVEASFRRHWGHDDAAPARHKYPVQLTHGSHIVRDVLEHMGADEKIERIVRVYRHIGDVDDIVDAAHPEIRSAVLPVGTSAQVYRQRR